MERGRTYWRDEWWSVWEVIQFVVVDGYSKQEDPGGHEEPDSRVDESWVQESKELRKLRYRTTRGHKVSSVEFASNNFWPDKVPVRKNVPAKSGSNKYWRFFISWLESIEADRFCSATQQLGEEMSGKKPQNLHKTNVKVNVAANRQLIGSLWVFGGGEVGYKNK